MSSRATGFFHVEKIDGKFWFVDPEGNLFISKGVNHVNYLGDYAPSLGYSPYNRHIMEKYGSVERWVKETIARLKGWGFNTIGAWSSEETYGEGMPYTIILDMALKAGANWQSGAVTDYFSKKFKQVAEEVSSKICASRRNDKYLLGYFTDNELRWAPDWRSKRDLFDDYMLLPPEAEGKQALVDFLREKYGEVSLLNRAWSTSFSSFEEILSATHAPKTPAVETDRLSFLRQVAKRYFKVTYDAIKKYDPNHLVLGCRFAYKPPDEVLEGCIGYVDVISINCYPNPYSDELARRLADFKKIHSITGLPIMVTEFSFKAMDSGLPNTRGASVPVKTQFERAKYFEEFVEAIMKQPFIVGYHWFQYFDQPYEGRFDGENSNYGLVTIRDEPWEVLTQKMTSVNLNAEALHLSSEEA
ncbi:MAG: beta-galactosidase [Candidatus Bathyarchaeia archaeon]